MGENTFAFTPRPPFTARDPSSLRRRGTALPVLRCPIRRAVGDEVLVRAEPPARVDRVRADADLEVAVRAGGVPGGAEERDRLSRLHPLARRHLERAVVRVER